ncbi:MAG: beta-lactamase family protein [Rhizobacter sp.]|nr:beta-lactamase family protein [Ferruginibacter sp.]
MIFITCSIMCLFCSCKSDQLLQTRVGCMEPLNDTMVNTHPKKVQLQQLIDSLAGAGVPGITMAVNQPGKGWFIGSAGMADIAGNKKFETCQVTRAGSIVKILTAVSVLKLKEQNLIDLDKKIADYLPADLLKDIDNANVATVRQLLNHSAGLYNYIQDEQFQLASLNDLTKTWQPNELLHYARNRNAYFAPGAGVRYSNTSYILLGMLIERVSGKHFSEYFKQHIFDPLQLKHTRFNINDPVPADLARGYTDYYNTGKPFESTYFNGWDYYTADGGLHAVPTDLCLIMRALFEGRLINFPTLVEMLQTVPGNEPGFFNIAYGLGIFIIQTPYGTAAFHSGDAIGYFGTVLYFPATGTTVSWMTNGNYGFIDPMINTKEAFLRILGRVFQ